MAHQFQPGDCQDVIKKIYFDGIIITGHGVCLTTPEHTLPIKAL